jgi:hypothetical protein
MIITKKDFPKPLFWSESLIDDFKNKNDSKKISTVVWEKEESIINEQVGFAYENNVDIVLSELLPSELPMTLSDNLIDFFRDRFVFVPPHTSQRNIQISTDEKSSITYINDNLSEEDEAILLLKNLNLNGETFLNVINIDYDNFSFEKVIQNVGNSKNILININNPQLLITLIIRLHDFSKRIKYINNRFRFSHRLNLFGFFTINNDLNHNQSIRSRFNFFNSTGESVIKVSRNETVFSLDCNNSVNYPLIESQQKHLICPITEDNLKSFIDTPIPKRNSEDRFVPALSKEEKRFFIHYIASNKENKDQLSAEFVCKCLEEVLLQNYHPNNYEFLSNILSISPHLLEISIKIAKNLSAEDRKSEAMTFLAETLIFANKFTKFEYSLETKDLLLKLFRNQHKVIKNSYYYHADFIAIEKSERLDFVNGILSEPTLKKNSFNRLLKIIPFYMHFDDWYPLVSTDAISDLNIEQIIQGYFLSNGISPQSITWMDQNTFNTVLSEHISTIYLLHESNPFKSSLINYILIRKDSKYFNSMPVKDKSMIPHLLLHIIFNHHKIIDDNAKEVLSKSSEANIIILFINYFQNSTSNIIREKLLETKLTRDLLNLIKYPHQLGFLENLATQINHPAQDVISVLNEKCNPFNKSMKNLFTEVSKSK